MKTRYCEAWPAAWQLEPDPATSTRHCRMARRNRSSRSPSTTAWPVTGSRQSLAARGLRATFYVPSGLVGRKGRLGWDDLRALVSQGYEIGGHTSSHSHLPALTASDARREIESDRHALLKRDLNPSRSPTPSVKACPCGSFPPALPAQCPQLDDLGAARCTRSRRRARSRLDDRSVPSPRGGRAGDVELHDRPVAVRRVSRLAGRAGRAGRVRSRRDRRGLAELME